MKNQSSTRDFGIKRGVITEAVLSIHSEAEEAKVELLNNRFIEDALTGTSPTKTDADDTTIVHVAWGESRAKTVRNALHLLGEEARVIALSGILSVGPLDPLRSTSRQDWARAKIVSQHVV